MQATTETVTRPKPRILLLGTGEMAASYLAVLRHLGYGPNEITILGRSRESADSFSQKQGVACQWGGTPALRELPVPDVAISAVSHLALAETASAILEKGCRYVLMEKPGALCSSGNQSLADAALRRSAHVFVAYNRRFYPSVCTAQKIIEDDGGLLSCAFDFTEVETSIFGDESAKKFPPQVLQRWGVANSLHVIDLALYFAAIPDKWACWQGGHLEWHSRNAIFCGAGTTDRSVLFSYLATWSGAGRWSLELTTLRRKIILRPLESLTVQRKGSFQTEAVDLPPEPPGLKPGLRGEVASFLSFFGTGCLDFRLCSLAEAIRHQSVAEKILGYETNLP